MDFGLSLQEMIDSDMRLLNHDGGPDFDLDNLDMMTDCFNSSPSSLSSVGSDLGADLNGGIFAHPLVGVDDHQQAAFNHTFEEDMMLGSQVMVNPKSVMPVNGMKQQQQQQQQQQQHPQPQHVVQISLANNSPVKLSNSPAKSKKAKNQPQKQQQHQQQQQQQPSSESSKENGFPKPAYSYSCLIALALKNSQSGYMSVSEIYRFMCEHFPYFKTAPNGWKNSVRHNLSLNKCFEKIEKPVTAAAAAANNNPAAGAANGGNQRKGCLWAMNPAKVTKMDEEVLKWSRKDPNAIKKGMRLPRKSALYCAEDSA